MKVTRKKETSTTDQTDQTDQAEGLSKTSVIMDKALLAELRSLTSKHNLPVRTTIERLIAYLLANPELLPTIYFNVKKGPDHD